MLNALASPPNPRVIGVRSFGVALSLQAYHESSLSAMIACLPPGWEAITSANTQFQFSLQLETSEPARPFYALYENTLLVARTPVFGDMLTEMEGRFRLRVAEFARGRVFMHAGVVAWHDQAILIPGVSQCGKSTLVAALVQSGARYYSDEFAALDERGFVHPFPCKPRLREPGVLPRPFSPEACCDNAGNEPLPVGLIILSQYRAGTRWRPRRLSTGQAVLAMLANTIPAQRETRKVLSTLPAVAARALVFKGNRGDVSDVVPWMLQQIDDR
jgi:hypothetical protein